jgi:hypothetical protein
MKDRIQQMGDVILVSQNGAISPQHAGNISKEFIIGGAAMPVQSQVSLVFQHCCC